METVLLSAQEVAAVRRWRLQRFRVRLAILLVALTAIGGLCYAIAPYAVLGWNITESLPGRVYLVVKTQVPGRGDLVAFYPPKNPYYPQHMYFTKIMVGMPGDVLAMKGREVFLNGARIGTALEYDTKGTRKLDMIGGGTIPEGKHFVWTPHPHSYDSRYSDIGLVGDEQIIGRAYRLL